MKSILAFDLLLWQIERRIPSLAVQITTYNLGDLLGKMAPLVFVLRDDNAIVVSPFTV
jgi:hypothetical protein